MVILWYDIHMLIDALQASSMGAVLNSRGGRMAEIITDGMGTWINLIQRQNWHEEAFSAYSDGSLFHHTRKTSRNMHTCSYLTSAQGHALFRGGTSQDSGITHEGHSMRRTPHSKENLRRVTSEKRDISSQESDVTKEGHFMKGASHKKGVSGE